MHNAQGAERALWTNSVLRCRDLTSPLAPSLEKWQQRQRMLRLWTEGKNANPKSFRSIMVRPARRRFTAPDHMTPSGQSEARISPSPANQRPHSRPLPVAFGLSVSWAVAERAGGCWIPGDPYPPRSETARLLCARLIWSAEEPQVKWPTREHDLWSNKCRVTHWF